MYCTVPGRGADVSTKSSSKRRKGAQTPGSASSVLSDANTNTNAANVAGVGKRRRVSATTALGTLSNSLVATPQQQQARVSSVNASCFPLRPPCYPFPRGKIPDYSYG